MVLLHSFSASLFAGFIKAVQVNKYNTNQYSCKHYSHGFVCQATLVSGEILCFSCQHYLGWPCCVLDLWSRSQAMLQWYDCRHDKVCTTMNVEFGKNVLLIILYDSNFLFPEIMDFVLSKDFGKNYLLKQVQGKVMKQTQGKYPAPLKIIEVRRQTGSSPSICNTALVSFEDGWKRRVGFENWPEPSQYYTWFCVGYWDS